MEWVSDYYTSMSRTFDFGRAVTDEHRQQAERIALLAGNQCRRVLELGCGTGALACALSDLGYSVVAVDLNAAAIEQARRLTSERRMPPTLVEADFYAVELGERFDLVYYWDGFGVGSDADQRRLLDRIGAEWLAPQGRALIDVFCPWSWIARSGKTYVYTALDGARWERTYGFDALSSRMLDAWTCLDRPDEPHRTQTLRCYAPQDFALLVEPTALQLEGIHAFDGRRLDGGGNAEAHLRSANGYLASLRKKPASPFSRHRLSSSHGTRST